ncbi:hypothetical protein DFJ74DRAFT_430775 [Hyaloraphidium curvatum]|nr:hypothetical protein DFJ74DRAFT_430775 [Hyaloraphidium curvatum]
MVPLLGRRGLETATEDRASPCRRCGDPLLESSLPWSSVRRAPLLGGSSVSVFSCFEGRTPRQAELGRADPHSSYRTQAGDDVLVVFAASKDPGLASSSATWSHPSTSAPSARCRRPHCSALRTEYFMCRTSKERYPVLSWPACLNWRAAVPSGSHARPLVGAATGWGRTRVLLPSGIDSDLVCSLSLALDDSHRFKD